MALDLPSDATVEESACQPSAPAAEEQSLRQPLPQVISPRDKQAVRLEEQMEKAHRSDV